MIIRNRDELVSHGEREGRALALDILEGGLQAADPYANTLKLIRLEGNRLLIGGQPHMDVSGFGDEMIDLDEIDHIYLIGAGKAVQRQAQALEDLLGDRLTAGAITVKKGEGCRLRRIEVTEGAHPVPDEASIAGTQRIVEIAERATERDLVLTVFSDGASSLAPLPASGITLDDLRTLYRLAIKFGSQSVIIRPMTYFSGVSRGRLLRMIHPARSVNLIMQVGLFPRWGGRLPKAGSFIPVWPQGERCMDADVRYFQAQPWWPELPAAMRDVLERRDPAYDVPDPRDYADMRYSFWQPIDLYQMVEGARARAEELGLRGVILSSHLTTISAEAANVLAQIAYECEHYGRPFEPPVALITGGHLDVPVGDGDGIGGRNQEFALAWGQLLGSGRLASKRVVVAAMDSDGTDGPGTQLAGGKPICMAGGIVDGYTLQEAEEAGVDIASELARHNSTIALMKLGSAIHTGNTGACLGDLRVAVVR
ncbi:MAG: glycerate kinase type-2 family protein [Anaerolineae bacterium]|jgi:glycerate 2-kinase